METIIETVEQAIAHEEWSINFHNDKLAESTESLRKLKNELNELKCSLMTEAKEFEV